MIEVNHLSKQFKLYEKPADRLKEIIFRRSYHHMYEALKDISFSVKSGETLGILGKNGAGKSTLLKIISGVLLADSGTINLSGKITGLLELGTGFDKELTGLQNITANGLLIGMTREQITKQQQNIIEFSELGDFIKEPIRTYSSGMVMRLAFSIAMHAKPDCFLIDEALSVGDAHFQQKCMQHIKQFKQKGGSILFVSHDLNAVKMICDQAIVLDQGKIVAQGTAEYAVNHYNRIMAKLDNEHHLLTTQNKQNYGNKKAKIIKSVLTGQQSQSSVFSCGEIANLNIDIHAEEDIDDITIGILIRDRFGQDIYGTNSYHLDKSFTLKKCQNYRAAFNIAMEIAPGKYTITLALHSQDNHIENCYHWIDNEISFQVAGIIGDKFSGICRLDSKLTLSTI
jgi:lipopolysaccharide transport system ATP-binding protein